ncbi:hypothetical protein ACFWZY_28785 [Streptomyces sp. NPDC058992]|uniref:hypothetical protein n=1 Tax=Streptomyces sp. NPDC058992 TaxID=3346688 RepID=UPI003683BF61
MWRRSSSRRTTGCSACGRSSRRPGSCEVAADLDEEEAEDYWHHGYLKFGSYEVTADGLTIDCRPGRDSYGAIGRFFDETGTGFGRADSLGAYLSELADQLESSKVRARWRSTVG